MLYLVIGKRKLLTLANNEADAVDYARRVFEENREDPGDLRAVSKYTADEPDRSMLAFWDAVAERAMSRGISTVTEIEEELRSLDVLLYHAVSTHVASSRRMEDAERRRCANIVWMAVDRASASMRSFSPEDLGYERAIGAEESLQDVFKAIVETHPDR